MNGTMMRIRSRFDVVTAKWRQTLFQSMTVRFVVISQILFGLHCLPVSISDVTEIPLITLGADVSSLSQSSRKREYSSTAGETDPRTYIEVLSGMDRV